MTIVYTTIFGGSDSLKPAPKGADRCVCFVDNPSLYSESLGWQLWVPRDRTMADARREAWHLRCISHNLFDVYDRVVWVDASFHLTDLARLLKDAGNAPIAALRHHKRRTCYEEAREIVKVGQARAADVQAQMLAYQTAGFRPDHLSISCVIVRDRSADVQRFNETWDAQIRKHPGDNTQLSLDYSAWKNGLSIKALKGTRHQNPYAVHDHADHKQRRRPYDTEAA